MVTPRRYAEVVVPQGTTTICWDPHEIGNVSGLDGLRWAIEATAICRCASWSSGAVLRAVGAWAGAHRR